MFRFVSALQEWFELRARMREERQFHLERAAADLRALGMTPREAKRMARIRFGGRRNSQSGLRELGGDLKGLTHLFHAHRVVASVWLQPMVLLAAAAMIVAASPSPREIIEGMLGRTLGPEDRGTVEFAIYGAGPATPGITLTELEALQSMATVTRAQILGPHQVEAHPVPGVTLNVITSEARVRTGNRGFYADWLPRQPKVMTSPAKVIWSLIALYGGFFLYTRATTRRWLLYAIAMGGLHALLSILAWAFTTQLWGRSSWSFPLLTVIYLLTAAAQCHYWWQDLRHRCPICLDRLLLSWTQGEPGRILFSAPVTESVCAHGHGVLTESYARTSFKTGVEMMS